MELPLYLVCILKTKDNVKMSPNRCIHMNLAYLQAHLKLEAGFSYDVVRFSKEHTSAVIYARGRESVIKYGMHVRYAGGCEVVNDCKCLCPYLDYT